MPSTLGEVTYSGQPFATALPYFPKVWSYVDQLWAVSWLEPLLKALYSPVQMRHLWFLLSWVSLAQAPSKDFRPGRRISYQAGLVVRALRPRPRQRPADSFTGGDEFLLRPTVVYSPGPTFCSSASCLRPLSRDFKDPAAQGRYRSECPVVFISGVQLW